MTRKTHIGILVALISAGLTSSILEEETAKKVSPNPNHYRTTPSNSEGSSNSNGISPSDRGQTSLYHTLLLIL
jgi:hypothetical protein